MTISQKIIGVFAEAGIAAGRFEGFVGFNCSIPYNDQRTYQWSDDRNFGQAKRVWTRRGFTSISCTIIAGYS
jgi:hypothetical protein